MPRHLLVVIISVAWGGASALAYWLRRLHTGPAIVTNESELPASLMDAAGSLRTQALGYPESTEDFPWGHSAFKVKGKAFLFLAHDEGWLKLSMKLPQSREFALAYPFTEPTGYGLGRAGWVSSRFGGDDDVPLDVLSAWLEESYRAIAPERLAAELG